jgi:hypothetical protein
MKNFEKCPTFPERGEEEAQKDKSQKFESPPPFPPPYLVLIKILCFCALKMTDSFSKNL